MSFKDSIVTCFQKIVTFDGRARRSEYWWFQLCIFIIEAILYPLLNQQGIIYTVLSIVIALASLSVTVRRLHDIGKSGWLVLLELIPVIGWIILLIWMCKDSEPGENKFGPNPKE